jgi:predicted transcriptional regulator of viral defense system
MERQHPAQLRRRLHALAAGQSGYFTAAQAQEIGHSYQSQKYHADHGNWRRVDRGVYRLPEWPTGPHDDLVRWTLWSGGRAVVSHESALAVHDLGDFDPDRIHLTVPASFSRRTPSVVLHTGDLPEDAVSIREGFSVTTPLRSLLDVAAGPDADVGVLAGAIGEALDRGVATRRLLRHHADELGDRAALNLERALREIGS